MGMPRRRDARRLHRPNPAQSSEVCSGLVYDPCDQPFLPPRKKTFTPYSPIPFEIKTICPNGKLASSVLRISSRRGRGQNTLQSDARFPWLGWSDPRVTLGTESWAKVGSLQPNTV